jgi:hypothetical protein
VPFHSSETRSVGYASQISRNASTIRVHIAR